MAILGRKKDNSLALESLTSILDSLDCEVAVFRGNDCEMLFANEKAKARVKASGGSESDCRSWLLREFTGLCHHCPNCRDGNDTGTSSIDMNGSDGRIYNIKTDRIIWADGKPASMFSVRDVTDERSQQEKYYALAYTDRLTGLPNRQKLLDDFDEASVAIAQGKLFGVLAIFDLDNFKDVNSNYGHDMGDLLLKHLAEHINTNEDFNGRLYRLGGDEFVLFYLNDHDRFVSDYAMERFYRQLFSQALKQYTVLNIDASCTLSMGASLFPKHGINYSDILRRADIALYKAKAAGKNRLEFFDEQYDEEKKLRDIYISIQPFLTRAGRTFGYELIDIEEESYNEDTVNLTNFNRAVDALGFEEINDNTKYLIPFNEMVTNKAVTERLPIDKFIIAVRIPSEWGDKDERRLQTLKNLGYSVAVTGVKSSHDTKKLFAHAEYCKFDPTDEDTSRQRLIIKQNPNIKFIADNVNDPKDFSRAEEMGFKLFQGYYFSDAPKIKKTKEISPLKANYFRLIQLTSTDRYVDFGEISAIISSDVAMSYKLLKLLNSASVGLREISSITMAVTYLGEENLKKWIGLLALRGIADDKPLELVRLSLIRARFGELLAGHMGKQVDENHVFLIGLLSLLDVALDISREQLMEEISVADKIRDSMLTDTGPYSAILRFFEDYERANWDEVIRFAQENNLSSQVVSDSYMQAVKWYNRLDHS